MSNEQKRILIVDDDISLGEVLQQALKSPSYPYDVRLARDGDEALAQVSRRDFDLIITDIMMGGLSGLQLLEALRQVAPEATTVAMTAFGSGEIEVRARNLGVYDYLSKPFTIQEFRQCIHNALQAREVSAPEGLPPLQSQSIHQTLAELRANTGVHAAFLIEEETTNVLGQDSDVNHLDLTSLSKILVDITHRMTAEVSRVFGGGSGFQRIQYVGETFNLSTYRLAGQGFLILVYDHRVKEGIISFYARQAVRQLQKALETTVRAQGAASTPHLSVLAPPIAEFPSPNSDPSEKPSEPISLEQALSLGLLNNEFLDLLDEGE